MISLMHQIIVHKYWPYFLKWIFNHDGVTRPISFSTMNLIVEYNLDLSNSTIYFGNDQTKIIISNVIYYTFKFTVSKCYSDFVKEAYHDFSSYFHILFFYFKCLNVKIWRLIIELQAKYRVFNSLVCK